MKMEMEKQEVEGGNKIGKKQQQQQSNKTTQSTQYKSNCGDLALAEA